MDNSEKKTGCFNACDFRRLAEISGILVWVTDSDGRYIYVSREVSDILGIEPREIMGRSVKDFLFFGPEEKYAVSIAAKLSAREAFSRLEIEGRRKDGSQVFLEISALPVSDD
ncbi:MAG: PAS domain-containing protein, partial [Candidatus Omnitrophica bacterium]|nr:PAS domain-containing protein [Candidatus Omnitrophota bacterium]